jgi:hypothetical protein
MEFFQEVHYPGLAIPALKQWLTIRNLPNLCASISTAAPSTESEGDLYCLWGAFNVRRDEIRNGVRYALVDCPHALAWTVTLDEARGHVIIHCTIDKTHPDPEFAESIHAFVSDWADGVRGGFQTPARSVATASL